MDSFDLNYLQTMDHLIHEKEEYFIWYVKHHTQQFFTFRGVISSRTIKMDWPGQFVFNWSNEKYWLISMAQWKSFKQCDNLFLVVHVAADIHWAIGTSQ